MADWQRRSRFSLISLSSPSEVKKKGGDDWRIVSHRQMLPAGRSIGTLLVVLAPIAASLSFAGVGSGVPAARGRALGRREIKPSRPGGGHGKPLNFHKSSGRPGDSADKLEVRGGCLPPAAGGTPQTPQKSFKLDSLLWPQNAVILGRPWCQGTALVPLVVLWCW